MFSKLTPLPTKKINPTGSISDPVSYTDEMNSSNEIVVSAYGPYEYYYAVLLLAGIEYTCTASNLGPSNAAGQHLFLQDNDQIELIRDSTSSGNVSFTYTPSVSGVYVLILGGYSLVDISGIIIRCSPTPEEYVKVISINNTMGGLTRTKVPAWDRSTVGANLRADGFDLANMTLDNIVNVPLLYPRNPIVWKPTGTRFFSTQNNTTLIEGSVSVPWNLNSTIDTSIHAVPTAFKSLVFSKTGKTMLLMDGSWATSVNNGLFKYHLSDPWNPTTALLVEHISLADVFPTKTSITVMQILVTPDESTLLVMGGQYNNTIYKAKLDVPLDMSGTLANLIELEDSWVSNEAVYGCTAQFSRNGTKLFLVYSNKIRTYKLSAPWQFGNATNINEYTNPAGYPDPIPGIVFSPYGDKLFMSGGDSHNIYIFNL